MLSAGAHVTKAQDWSTAAAQRTARRVMLVDDDERLTSALAACFKARGYEVLIEPDGTQALRQIMVERPDIIILESLLPGVDRLQIFKEIRANTNVPLVVLSTRGDSFDRVVGLEMGADEYLIKPLDPRVVLAHVEALLRRTERDVRSVRLGSTLKIGPFIVSRLTRTASYNGRRIELTASDFELLWVLLNNYGGIVERHQLVKLLKLGESGGIGRALDGRAFRLRRKLEEAGAPTGIIKSLRGRGLMLIADEHVEFQYSNN